MDGGIQHSFESAKFICENEGGFLAQPEGWLHHEVYELIYQRGNFSYNCPVISCNVGNVQGIDESYET